MSVTAIESIDLRIEELEERIRHDEKVVSNIEGTIIAHRSEVGYLKGLRDRLEAEVGDKNE